MSQESSGEASRPAVAGRAAGGKVRGFTPLATGTRLGELVVQSVLGAGEFGITYITEHEKRSKRYVLKEYFPRMIARREGYALRPFPTQLAAYKWGLERFLSEARGLQQVKHAALVEILGITQTGGTGYVGMAYEAGRDYSIWLHEHKRIAPQEELDKILAPLLEGLALAHAAKVYHFDMDPDCILIRDNGTPVLVDFGVFRVGMRRRLPAGDPKARPYSAPELQVGTEGPVGPWTDVYSLAGLLYLSVTGKPPMSAFERSGGGVLPSAAASAQGKYRSDFLAAIDAGLRLNPAQRPRTVGDWSKVLLRANGSRWLPRFSRAQENPDATAANPAPPSAAPTAREREEQQPISLGAPTPPPVQPSADPAPASATVENPAQDTPKTVSAQPVRAVRTAIAALFGLIIGGTAGTFASYLFALLRQDCTANCAAPLILPLACLGALIGACEGLRYAKRTEVSQGDYDF